ncbi:MAG: hypothetical protein L0332_30205 [Chloroflexi bacterium]|nr:hypothetical protein [Chloroflexota bacterium]MCI0575338.1 hypothetical protein [Chloroflexota bacterium]MCI0646086.1 hypothetical protein [Chloroflexota bacterium]MCI0730976.1 hypothetical protein [Chloroflexota bacterium]
MLPGNIRLTLLMGPIVPVPVPKAFIDALVSVEVRNAAGEPSGFQLTFTFSNKSALVPLLLLLGQIGPFIRTIIVVTVNGTPHVLMDGVVVQHQVTPNVETGQATLTVTGSDLTAVLAYVDFTGIPYPAMPAEARVAFILLKYAAFGIVPLIIPSLFLDVPIPISRIPTHQGKDLEYINRLAGEVGYVFYIEPGPAPGVNVAYWGPEIKVGVPQPALNVNMDAHTNVESLSFTFNGASKVMPIVFIQNEETKVPIPIPIPDISPLNPPLGLIPPFPARFEMMTNTANLNPAQAIALGLAEAAKTSDAVTGTGTLDVLRYGRILKARGLVGVRGAGDAFNGLYFVKSVTHKIQRGQYKQDFTLTRNGLVSTVPRVPA